MKLDHELRTAREKIVMSERGKEIVEARMKVGNFGKLRAKIAQTTTGQKPQTRNVKSCFSY